MPCGMPINICGFCVICGDTLVLPQRQRIKLDLRVPVVLVFQPTYLGEVADVALRRLVLDVHAGGHRKVALSGEPDRQGHEERQPNGLRVVVGQGAKHRYGMLFKDKCDLAGHLEIGVTALKYFGEMAILEHPQGIQHHRYPEGDQPQPPAAGIEIVVHQQPVAFVQDIEPLGE